MTDTNTCYCGRPIQGTTFQVCKICRSGTPPGGGGDGPDGGPGVMGGEETETTIEA